MQLQNHLWQSSQDIIDKIFQLPFIQELTAGTLPRATFDYYLQQDMLYLQAYSRALAITATKAPSMHEMLLFYQFAMDAIKQEYDSHHEGMLANTEISPNTACFAYSHFLTSTALHKSYFESVAAVLPCFWIYAHVAEHIAKEIDSAHPYYDWVAIYIDSSFIKSLNEVLDIINNAHSQLTQDSVNQLSQHFRQASNLEYQFWQQAYDCVGVN